MLLTASENSRRTSLRTVPDGKNIINEASIKSKITRIVIYDIFLVMIHECVSYVTAGYHIGIP